MTVAELITVLQTHDQTKEVQIWNHHTRQFVAPLVEQHIKRKNVLLLVGQPWFKPWSTQ